MALSLNKISSAFVKFVQKSVEVFAVAGTMAFALGIVYMLFAGLLSLIDFDIPMDIASYTFFLTFGTLPFIALSLTYDFEAKLEEQTSFFDGKNLFSQITWILSFAIACFLFIYILILSPSQFGLILDTGYTSSLFFSLLLTVNMLFFLVDLLLPELAAKTKKLTVHCMTALTIEMLVLGIVALNALYLRIEQYAFTVDRYMVLSYLVILLGMSVAYAYTSLKYGYLTPHTDKFVSSSQVVQFYGVLISLFVAMLFSTVIDLDLASAKSQIGRVRGQDDLEKRLDRRYFRSMNVQVAKLVADEYEGASNKYKLDIALTLFEMKNYYGRSEKEEDEIDNTLFDVSRVESNNGMSTFVKKLQSKTSLYDQNGYYCRDDVSAILDINLTAADKFCDYRGYGWN